MKFTIINPTDNTAVQLRVHAEDYNGEQGLRIIFPEKDSFIIVQKDGQWKVMDETDMNPKLIDAIAERLKPVARYTT